MQKGIFQKAFDLHGLKSQNIYLQPDNLYFC